MFWSKLKSSEFLELFQKIETQSITIEALKLDLDLYKKKLRVAKKIDEPEDIKGGVILPEHGTS